MAVDIVFGTLEAANEFRDRFPEYISDEDDRRERTVAIREDTPEEVADRAVVRAVESRAEREEGSGQTTLTDDERDRIDFSREGVNVPKAKAIKAVFLDNGVGDWLSEADLSLTVDENREIAEDSTSAGTTFLSEGDVSPRAGQGPRRGGAGRPSELSGPLTLEDIEPLRRSIERQDRQVKNRIRELIDEFGIEPVVDAIGGLSAPAEVEESVDEILSSPVYDEQVFIDEIRSELSDALELIDADLQVTEEGALDTAAERAESRERRRILNRLGSEFGAQFDSVEQAVDEIRRRIRRAQAGENVLTRLSETFGRELDSADEAIEAIREESGIEVAREEVLTEINESFGFTADTLDEAVAELNEQLKRAQRSRPGEIPPSESNERAERALALLRRGDDSAA